MKVVFLDWYGTLSVSHFFEHWRDEAHAHHVHYNRMQTWWRANPPLLTDWIYGRADAEGYVAEMARFTGLSETLLMDELVASCGHWRHIDPDTEPLVRALQARGIRVVLATDNVDACFRWAVPAMGLEGLFDDVLSSHALGWSKADVDASGRCPFFAPWMAANGVEPGTAVLIDDAAYDEDSLARTGITLLPVAFGEGPRRSIEGVLATLPV